MSLTDRIRSIEKKIFGEKRFNSIKEKLENEDLEKITISDLKYLEKYYPEYYKNLQKSVEVYFYE